MKYEELSIFTQRIKLLREKQGLTQKKMGELLGFTDRNYQKIEYGNVKLNALLLIQIADYFGVSLDYLVGRCDDPQSHTR